MGNNHKPNRPQTKEPRRYYGYIVSFFEEKNFGFVRTADNEDFFFHAGAAMGFTPAPGIKVIFTLSNKKPAPGKRRSVHSMAVNLAAERKPVKKPADEAQMLAARIEKEGPELERKATEEIASRDDPGMIFCPTCTAYICPPVERLGYGAWRTYCPYCKNDIERHETELHQAIIKKQQEEILKEEQLDDPDPVILVKEKAVLTKRAVVCPTCEMEMKPFVQTLGCGAYQSICPYCFSVFSRRLTKSYVRHMKTGERIGNMVGVGLEIGLFTALM